MASSENGTDEPLCKAEIETQKWRTRCMVTRREWRKCNGMDWETGIDTAMDKIDN